MVLLFWVALTGRQLLYFWQTSAVHGRKLKNKLIKKKEKKKTAEHIKNVVLWVMNLVF